MKMWCERSRKAGLAQTDPLYTEIRYSVQLAMDIYQWQEHCFNTAQSPGTGNLQCFAKQSIPSSRLLWSGYW